MEGWKSFKSFKRTCGAVLKVGNLWETRRISASAPHNASVIGDPAEHLTDDGETNKQQHKQHKPTTFPRGNNTPPRQGMTEYYSE